MADGAAFLAAERIFLEKDRNLIGGTLFESTEAGWEEKPRSRQC
jgi:hypothetical protein